MTEIKWTEPPQDRRGVGRWNEVAAALRSNPGRWALIAEGVGYSLANGIKRGNYAAFAAFRPAEAFEVRSASVAADGKTRRFDIYARYVGDEATR